MSKNLEGINFHDSASMPMFLFTINLQIFTMIDQNNEQQLIFVLVQITQW